MKKVTLYSAIFLSMFTLSLVANAETSTTTSTTSTSGPRYLQAQERREQAKENIAKRMNLMEQRKLELEKKIQERKTEREARISERKIKLDEIKKEKILKSTQKINNKLEDAIEKLEKQSQRIADRIKSFEERDLDMTKSKELLSVANQTIATTKTEIEKIKQELNTKIESGEIASNEVRVSMQAIKDLIKDSKDDLVAVIVSIKASIKK